MGSGMEGDVVSRRPAYLMTLVLAALALVATPVRGARAATTATAVIYSFGGEGDGEYPSTDLVRDGAGDLYGTTVQQSSG